MGNCRHRLGTTTHVQCGSRTQWLSNAEGERITPSVVGFPNPEKTVRRIAKRQAITNQNGPFFLLKADGY